MKIGIFGGSFNPIHLGHIRVAERAVAAYGLDKVLVVPAHVSPFKTDGATALFDDETRWRMVVAACAGHPLLEPCNIELKRGGVSFAIDTVRAIAAQFPAAELYFIIGEDSVAGLPHWKDYSLLTQLCTFISFPRTEESSTAIRAAIKSGQNIDHWLPEGVAKIIASL